MQNCHKSKLFPFLVYIIDPDTYELLYINKHLKGSSADYQGRKCWEIIHNREKKCDVCKVDKALSLDEAVCFGVYNKTDKRHYQMAQESVDWYDGSRAVQCIKTDVTDIKSMQMELDKAYETIEKKTAEIDRLDMIDGLTGIHNRKGFEWHLYKEVERNKRYNAGFRLIMIDIDHFKKFHKQMGKKIGEEILIEVANMLKEYTRINDVKGRWEDEEFLILMPVTCFSEACRMAENLRIRLRDIRLTEALELTASMAVAEFYHFEKCDAVLERLRRIIEIAKESGRNCTKTERDL